MKRKTRELKLGKAQCLTLCLSLAASACAPSAVLAAKPATQATKQAAKTAAQASVLKNVTVSLTPGALAKTIKISIIPAVDNVQDDVPFMNGEPEHFRVQFDNDKLSDYTNFGERQLLVYPLAQYSKLFKGKEKVEYDKVVWQLQTVISKKSDGGLKTLPILPAVESAEIFHSHVEHLLFKQGKGIAFLACYAQDDSPVSNGDFFYTYQGITDDLKYYVSLFVPVTAKGFPKNLPSKKAKEFLSKLPASSFTPNLDQIAAMIQSISIK